MSNSNQSNPGRVALISLGHFVHDVFSSFLAPLLPLIIDRLGLSLTLSASLTVFQRLPAAISPWIGLMADRRDLRWIIALAPGLTALLMCLLGFAPGYLSLGLMLLIAGLSSAAFHVPSAVIVARESGRAKGQGLSVYQLAGELARTLGPLVAVSAASIWTLDGLWRLLPIGLGTSLLLAWRCRRMDRVPPPAREMSFRSSWRLMRGVLLPVLAVVLIRSFLVGALATFLPLYLKQNGASLVLAGALFSLYQLSGAAGSLVMGALSDRWGRRRVLVLAVGISPLLLLLFLMSNGWLRVVTLLPLGFFALSTTAVMIALVQENSGAHPGTAHGMFIATGFGIRSVMVLAVGALADIMGLHLAFLVCAATGFAALPLLSLLPADDPQADVPPE